MTAREAIAQTRMDGRQRDARCPAHEDRRASLSVGRGDDGRILLHCQAGCPLDAVLAAAGLTVADIMPARDTSTERRVVTTYRYEDERGMHLYDVLRFEPKDFRQRAADGSWSTKGIRRVLYRLPHLAGCSTVYVTEGERDADALAALGLPATSNPGGAGKWRAEYAGMLRQAGCTSVVVLPDADDPGRAHARDVAASCHAAGLGVRVLELPHLPPKGDVSDWLAAGGTADALRALARACPIWTPTTAGTSTRPALDLVGLDALLAEPDDAVEWLVDDRFAFGSVNLLAGKPKAGKSTLARALALAVARGESWLGSRCRFGRVVYVALEDKRSEVRRHLRGMGATGTEPIRLLIGQAPKTLLADLDALIAAGDTIDLLIIDTAQRLLQVKDANDYAVVTTAFEPVLALARTRGTCIVLLHHAGKVDRAGLDSLLGSTAWAGSVDNVLLLNRNERYRVLSSVQRIGPDLDDTVVAMDEATGDVRLAGARYLVDRQAVAAALFEALAEAGPDGLLRADLLTAVEGRHAVKVKALDLLLTDSRVARTGAGTKGDPHRFRVVGNQHPDPPANTDSSSLVPSIGREPAFLSQVPSVPTDGNASSRERAGSRSGSHDAEVPDVRY